MKLLFRHYRFPFSFLFLALLINPLFSIYLDGGSTLLRDEPVQPIEGVMGDKAAGPQASTPNTHTPDLIESIFRAHHTDIIRKNIAYVAEAVYHKSVKYGYDPLFILAIIKTESSFLNRAVSHMGARGLMQIVPKTAREIARKNNINWHGFKTLHTPASNIEMGTFYLTELLKKFNGNIVMALEAYNNGPARILRLIDKGEQPNYRYATKVLKNYREFLNTFDKWG